MNQSEGRDFDKFFFGGKVRFIIYAFFAFQLLSLLGYFWPSISAIVFFIFILGTLFLSLYKLEYGFLILIFEFFAGHGGHLFEFADISLRTGLFLIVIFVWLFRKAREIVKQPKLELLNSPLLVLFLLLLFLVIVGGWHGLINNQPILAIKDLINYSYIFLIFPLVDILKKQKFLSKVFNLSSAAAVGIALLTIIILVLFVTNLVEVHDPFYWWWRGTAIGKATYTSNNFFRIVTPAHLLILPLFLVYLSFLAVPSIYPVKSREAGISPKAKLFNRVKLKSKKKKGLIWLAVLASLAILINFSRAYFLGVFIGLIFLGKNLSFRRWLVFFLTVIIILVLEFGLLYAIVSGGQTLAGLSYFKERIQSLGSPEQELSSLTRMVILPKLIEKIKQQPVFGHGLGSTVSYLDPISNEQKTTFHLDWGYLEIWLELGLFALLFYLSIIGLIFYSGWQKLKSLKDNVFQKRLTVGLLAGLASIAVATLTGPFLFHPLGIFYLTFVAAYVTNKPLQTPGVKPAAS